MEGSLLNSESTCFASRGSTVRIRYSPLRREDIDILEARINQKLMRSESKKTSNTNQRASNTATLLSENDAGEGVLLEKPIGLLTGHKERREGHMKDAWALGGDEGRDKLR